MKGASSQLASVLCVIFILSGLGIWRMGDSPKLLSPEEARLVVGGEPAEDLTYDDCPAATPDCSYLECDDAFCNPNTMVKYQNFETYPSGTEEGSDWKTTEAKEYKCNYSRACSNPCLQSTLDDKYYCGGPVGPNMQQIIDGLEGVEPADKET
jgi:hypothetical protein